MPTVTLILGSPDRFHLIAHTYRHLAARQFPYIFWVRTPSGEELDTFDEDATKRCMMFWYATVLPCLQTLHDEWGTCEAFVVEDTFLCNEGVTFDRVYEVTHNNGSGVFGYGGYKHKKDRTPAWHGSKGFYLTRSWWEEMAIVLENSSLADWRHWDNWLRDRQRTGAQPEFKCFEPLGGYNHRTSGTYKGGERFGGAWLPGCDNLKTKHQTEAYLLSNAPLIVQKWVQICKIMDPTIKRGAPVPCSLDLPPLTPRDALAIGIYSFHPDKDNVVPEVWRKVPLVSRVLTKPSWKVRTSSGAMSDLDEVYELQRWRQTNVKLASMMEHEPLPVDVLYIAEIRFKDVATSYLPICPRLGDMVI